MTDIPHTYWDDNPEDRRYVDDFWAWLKEQPQQAWLYYARRANWDQADSLFVWMVEDERCDRALASWLFWSADPTFAITQGKRPSSNTIIGAVLDRIDKGGFPEAQLHYLRVEVAFNALRTAEALNAAESDPPFRIPRQLCASFEGRNADLPSYDEQTERDLAELFEFLNGALSRTDEDSYEWQRKGGNWWYEPALQLPDHPRVTPELSDVEAIEAVFGPWRETLARIERLRGPSAAVRTTQRDPLRSAGTFILMNLVGVACFTAALYLHTPVGAIIVLVLWFVAILWRFL